MYRVLAIAIVSAAVAPAHAGETDQFLAWSVDLNDSAPAINNYLNDEIAAFLASRDAATITLQSDLAEAIYFHLFKGLYASRIRHWLHHAPDVDRFPDKSVSWWEYQSKSVYNRRSFPYFLPMSRTIRVGDVYTGIDKFCHFFGFGRRFYIEYVRLLAEGLSDREAREEVVLHGIVWEHLIVGKLVDGIFSPADIEAAYQGMLLCRDLASKSSGYITHNDGGWTLARHVDLRNYVTPDFDESYNPCHYWGLRKRFVIPTLRSRYAEQVDTEAVRARFHRYGAFPKSFCREVITRHFDGKAVNPQREQFRDAFGPQFAGALSSTPATSP